MCTLRGINCTLFATSQTPFIHNACTDCVKLYISDQQAKAAWRALLVSWIIHNYHLAHSSIHFDYRHTGHNSLLSDTHSLKKTKRRRRKEKRETSCCENDPTVLLNLNLEREHKTLQEVSTSTKSKYTLVWCRAGVENNVIMAPMVFRETCEYEVWMKKIFKYLKKYDAFVL